MNKNKICNKLLNKISVLNTQKFKNVFVFSENFNKTEQFLKNFKYSYTPYPFINSFYLPADHEDLNILSLQNHVSFIQHNARVQTLNTEQDFINLSTLTENKFFGQGQTICFIDTGIYPHLDFVLPKSKIIKFIDLVNKKESCYDDNGHGTFVAGIACGNGIFSNTNIGIATQSNIISIKALSKDGDSNSNIILDAMQWVYENWYNNCSSLC